MDAETLDALKASIAKWKRNAKAETPAGYSANGWGCPLCWLFVDQLEGDACVGCPDAIQMLDALCSKSIAHPWLTLIAGLACAYLFGRMF